MGFQAPSKIDRTWKITKYLELLPNAQRPGQVFVGSAHLCRCYDSSRDMASATRMSAVDEIDPSSDDFPNDQVRLVAAEKRRSRQNLPRVPR